MFIQVIQAPCRRHDEVRALERSWSRGPGRDAPGWLGGTYGFTDDDMFVAVVRFADRESAMANSARPETAAFAEQLEALVDGPLEFHDCDDVTVFLDGGSDDAGFVQVIRGRVQDPARLKSMLGDAEALRSVRPEIVGGTLAIEPDGTFTETVAFTDEASARRGEQQAMPPEMEREISEALSEAMADARYFDLRHPWFETAG